MVRAQTAVQLQLPCTLDQATLLAQEVARLESKLTETYEELAATKQERDAYWQGIEWWQKEGARLEDELTAVEARLDAMRESRDYYHKLYLFAETLLPSSRHRVESHTLPAWLDAALKSLIREAHPDKWSAQQPATELAHALTVGLNDLRGKLGEVRG